MKVQQTGWGWRWHGRSRARDRWMAACLAILAMGAGTFVSVAPSEAGWLTKLAGLADEAVPSGKFARLGAPGLDDAMTALRSVPDSGDAVRLAAVVTPEGHWTFANRNGEVFTAANRNEMGRVVSALAPEALLRGDKPGLALYLPEDAVFKHHQHLEALPDGARLHITSGKSAYRLVKRPVEAGVKGPAGLAARIKPNVQVPLTNRADFAEAVWQLERSLRSADIRVIALDANGPDALRGTPVYDKARKSAKVDRLSPDGLVQSFRDVRGQTVLITGDVRGDRFVATPSGGSERSFPLRDLTQAAAANDVNLVILQANGARQPGGRNWLWQTVEVDGLQSAVKRARYADFFDALAAPNGPFEVRVNRGEAGRVSLDVRPPGRASAPMGGVVEDIGSVFGQVVSEVTGNVVTNAITADLNSKERQRELNWRLVPYIPSAYQFAYLFGLVFGMASWSTLRAWWRRVWKKEVRSDYPGAAGYHAARVVKFIAFLAIFLPVAGPFAFIFNAAVTVWTWIMLPVRLVGALFRQLGSLFGSRAA